MMDSQFNAIRRLYQQKVKKETILGTFLLFLSVGMSISTDLLLLEKKPEGGFLWFGFGLLAVFLWLRYWLVKYRVANYFFGYNTDECKDLIQFIVEESKRS